jgi:Tfp pilus assembly protein PilF
MFPRIACYLWLIAAACVAMSCTAHSTTLSPGGYRAITADPGRDTDAAAHFDQVGLDFLDAGDLDKAEAAFQQALAADVTYGPAHNNLGKVFFKQKAWYKAAWEFDYACSLLPKHAEPQNNLGLVLEASGELDRAVEPYRKAITLAPDNIVYRANLVRTLVRRGDRTDEVRGLLEQVAGQDTRPEWRDWARLELTNLGFKRD